MNSTSELIVYKASAGSGKTFTLAVEYIKLLIENPHGYRNILAVTFTNKATAEMKERILSQLYGIAMQDKASDAYLNVLTARTGLPEEEIRQKAATALSLIIHDYNFFRVETIDSFFQSVMKNLSRELGLGYNLEISLDDNEVLSTAVDQLIENLQRNSPVLHWLMEFIDEKLADDKKWHVDKEIKEFGKNIFNEVYKERGDALRQKLQNPQFIAEYKKVLQKTSKEISDNLKGYGDRFFELLEENGLQVEDLFRGKSGVASYFNKLRNGQSGNDLVNKTMADCFESEECWCTKKATKRDMIIPLAANVLMPLLHDAERYRTDHLTILNSCTLSLRYLNQLRLLNYIDKEVRDLNHDQNRFLLSDTNNLLCKLMDDGDSSFVFEKIGTNIHHVMIDEFQDTSRMQWVNFKMLLMEGLSQGTNSLIVGDVKQSIYRWRNGDWSILNGLNDRLGPFPILQQSLTVNRRSETNIIQFNNTFFREACTWLEGMYEYETGEPCETLLSAYRELEQDSPKEEKRGYVEVNFVKPEEGTDYNEQTLHDLGEKVKELVENGVTLNDIAILIRKNKFIPVIADYFSLHYPDYPIVSDLAFRLDSSKAVNLIIKALRYLSDSEDTVSKAQLTTAYQYYVCGVKMTPEMFWAEHLDRFLPAEFTENERLLRLMPLYELTEKVIELFHLAKLPKQDAYLYAFLDRVSLYLQDHSSDLTAFLDFWDEKLRQATIPAGELNGIRILSIHKSKGLEFHTVLIPYCDWTLEAEAGKTNLLWCSTDQPPFNNLDLIPVGYSSMMNDSVFKEEYGHERLQLWVDNLNLLYVAFTRAGKNLIVWTKPHKDDRYVASELIYNALHAPSEDRYTAGELVRSQPKQARNVTNRLLQPSVKTEVPMTSYSKAIEFRQSNKSAEFIRNDEEADQQEEYIQRGKLLHRIFSAIHTLDDVDGVLRRLQFEGVIDNNRSLEEIRGLVRKAVTDSNVAHWFSREWKLYNECAILQHTPEGVTTRRPDRVMTQGDNVVVVDFKFGKRREEYRHQVEEYMQLLRQMGYTQVDGYLWYVYKNEIDKVNPQS